MTRTTALLLFTLAAGNASAATLDRVLTCGRPGEAGGLGSGTDLTRVTIDTSRFPDAVCNDQTPGVFYVSPFTREEDRHKWVIFLQGGGGCNGGQDCASRWCSAGTNFGMDKMSSSLTKPSIAGNGILDRRQTNRFGGWNHVLIYYCSSDNWSGNKPNRLSASSSSGGAIEYDIHFRGAKIIEAALSTLRVTRRGRPVGNRAATGGALPDLDEATEVLLAGSSAGGGGVRNNADTVGTILRAGNIRCSGSSGCPLIYRAAVDASFGPDSADVDFSRSTFCAADPRLCTYEGVFRERYDSVVVATWGAQQDDTCVAWHRTNAPGTEWRCADGEHLFAHHITSELFARQDLQDNLISGNFAEAGLGSREDFGRLQEADLRELPSIAARAEEGPVAGGGKSVGVYGPQCTDHESFTSNRAFYNVVVTQQGTAYSFHDVLWNWWSGAGPQVVIRAFSGRAGAAPECP